MGPNNTQKEEPELEFILRQLRHYATLSRQTKPPAPYSSKTNWKRWWKWVQWHRLSPIIASQDLALAKAPTSVIEALRKAQTANALRSLNRKREHRRILSAFQSNGIELLAIKGPALEHLYPKSAISRYAGDLDLLTRNEAIANAEKILLELGYRKIPGDLPSFTEPHLSPKQRQFLTKHESHLRFRHSESNLVIELHWKLSPNSHTWAIPFDLLWERRTSFPIGDQTAFTLSLEDHLMFLVLHGAFHAWFRLFWLFDIALLLGQATPKTIESLLNDASQHHCARALAGTLELLRTTLQLSIPSQGNSSPELPPDLSSYPRSLQSRFILPERRSPIESLRHLTYRYHLLETLSAKTEGLMHFSISPLDFERMPLPDRLFPLYMALRPLFWLQRKLTR